MIQLTSVMHSGCLDTLCVLKAGRRIRMDNANTMMDCLNTVSNHYGFRNWPVVCREGNLIYLNDIPQKAGKLYADQSKPKWIPVNERMPENGDTVLIVIDVRKWDAKRKVRVETASVGFFEEPTRIGGPISLTGYKTIQGIYFAIPAIMHPEAVTHWMPLPEPPRQS